MLNIFKTRANDAAFLGDCISLISKSIPPEYTKDKIRSISVNKTTRIIEKIVTNVVDYQVAARMGRMRFLFLVNDLQWRLRDKGYSREFVSIISEAIVAKSIIKKQDSQK